MQSHRFTPTTFLIWGGLLLYALNFLVVYIFAALACAKGFAHGKWLGMSPVPLVTTISGLVAAAAISAVMWSAAGGNRREQCADEHTRFIRFLAIAGGFLSLLAVVWLTLPPLLLANGCMGQHS